jgi:hypothetical protein
MSRKSAVKPGKRFGRWKVLRFSQVIERKGVRYPMWVCACSCGTTVRSVLAWGLTSGKSRSCGCLAREQSIKHGQWGERIYDLWVGMLSRCKYPYASQYAQYGGRGIKVCERWRTFQNFYDDMGDPPSRRHSLDRYPNRHGDYQPGNVRWATMKEQSRNKDCVILDEAKAAEIRALRGVLFQREIAEKFGISRGMVGHIQRGKAWV